MTTEDRVRRFIVERFGRAASQPGSLGDDVLLIEEGIVDSLGIFQLVAHIEGEFGLRVEDEELVAENFGTIAEIARLIRSKLPAGG